MRILLDHCVPRPFARAIASHDVKTASQMNWQTLSNGRLLAAAADHFDVLVTVDKNMKSQQNLKTLGVAVIIIDVRQSTSEPLMLLAPHVEMTLQRIQRGQMMLIEESGAITLLA